MIILASMLSAETSVALPSLMTLIRQGYSQVADHLSTLRRSENMARILSKDTKPELIVRRLCHRMGYRFRLHSAKLPGKPDIVFGPRKCVIFVHGCFWHQHPGCRRATVPKSRPEYWLPKLQKNVQRDRASVEMLEELGWRALIIWECETRNDASLIKTITGFLGSRR